MSVRSVRRRVALVALVAVGLLAACGRPAGGAYPALDVQVVVPYPAGSAIDATARALVDVINKQGKLGRRMQVVNKEGGAGSVGTTTVLNAKPDGYTVGILPDGPLTLVPLTEDVSYDPKSATVLSEVTTSPVLFTVPAGSPYRKAGDHHDGRRAAQLHRPGPEVRAADGHAVQAHQVRRRPGDHDGAAGRQPRRGCHAAGRRDRAAEGREAPGAGGRVRRAGRPRSRHPDLPRAGRRPGVGGLQRGGCPEGTARRRAEEAGRRGGRRRQQRRVRRRRARAGTRRQRARR